MSISFDPEARYYIITGANEGIGFATARQLYAQNECVIMMCRNSIKGKAAQEKIVNGYEKKFTKKSSNSSISMSNRPSNHLILMLADLDDPTSLVNFATQLIDNGVIIAAIMHNAGVFMDINGKERILTSFCIEQTISTNYIGAFLLNEILINYLKEQHQRDGLRIRIMCLGTRFLDHKYNMTVSKYYRPFDPMDLEFEHRRSEYNGFAAYVNSKYALLLWMTNLYKEHKNDGIDTIIYFPDYVPGTKIGRHQTNLKAIIYKNITTLLKNVRHSKKTVAVAIAHFLTSCDKKEAGHAFNGIGDKFNIEIVGNTPELQKVLHDKTIVIVNRILNQTKKN